MVSISERSLEKSSFGEAQTNPPFHVTWAFQRVFFEETSIEQMGMRRECLREAHTMRILASTRTMQEIIFNWCHAIVHRTVSLVTPPTITVWMDVSQIQDPESVVPYPPRCLRCR